MAIRPLPTIFKDCYSNGYSYNLQLPIAQFIAQKPLAQNFWPEKFEFPKHCRLFIFMKELRELIRETINEGKPDSIEDSLTSITRNLYQVGHKHKEMGMEALMTHLKASHDDLGDLLRKVQAAVGYGKQHRRRRS